MRRKRKWWRKFTNRYVMFLLIAVLLLVGQKLMDDYLYNDATEKCKELMGSFYGGIKEGSFGMSDYNGYICKESYYVE